MQTSQKQQKANDLLDGLRPLLAAQVGTVPAAYSRVAMFRDAPSANELVTALRSALGIAEELAQVTTELRDEG